MENKLTEESGRKFESEDNRSQVVGNYNVRFLGGKGVVTPRPTRCFLRAKKRMIFLLINSTLLS